MNAFEKLRKYLLEEFDISLHPVDEEEDVFPCYDPYLEGLLTKYGNECRREGYTKGFKDGENSDD